MVDAADYNIWRSRFGSIVGSGVGAIAAVPESAGCILLIIGVFCACGISARQWGHALLDSTRNRRVLC
jgi:hypothetical protein